MSDETDTKKKSFDIEDLPVAEQERVLSQRSRLRVLMFSDIARYTIGYYKEEGDVLLGEITLMSVNQIEFMSYTTQVTAEQIGTVVTAILQEGKEAFCDDC